MRGVRALIAALVAALSAAAPAWSQAVDPDAVAAPELVVTGKAPGPAWWRVSRGNATVWILGLPSAPTPLGLEWDKSVLRRRLALARALEAPVEGQVRVGADGFSGLVTAVRLLPGLGWTNGDVEKAMPADLAARFDASRQRLGQPASRYATPVPALAVFKLDQDYRRVTGLSGDVEADVEILARQAHVPIVRPERLTAAEMKAEALALTRPEMADCFRAFLAETETPPTDFEAAAAGWAGGRLALALAAPPNPYDLCESRIFAQRFTHRLVQAETAAVETGLQQPGVLIVTAPLRALVAQGGVVQSLKADGYAVTDPTVME